MYLYSGFSLNIESEIELPELPPGSGNPDVIIRFGHVDATDKPATIDDEMVFPRNIGGFHIRHGREIVVDLCPHADMGTVGTLLTGRFLGYLLRQRGYLPLHASAVAIDGKSVLFMGESGAGKSTTAAAFYSHGHSVLSDDVAAVRTTSSGIELHAGWPGLRLLENSRGVIGLHAAPADFQNEKHVYRLLRTPRATSFPVKKIYFLDYENPDGAEAVRSFPLSVLSAAALLNTHSRLRYWRAGAALRQMNLDRAAAIATVGSICHLMRRRSLNFLPQLVEFVEKDILADA